MSQRQVLLGEYQFCWIVLLRTPILTTFKEWQFNNLQWGKSHFLVFEQYQKARTQFVQTVAELSTRPQNIETLQAAGVMQLLRPLLLDVVPTVQFGIEININYFLSQKNWFLIQLWYPRIANSSSCVGTISKFQRWFGRGSSQVRHTSSAGLFFSWTKQIL